MRELLKKELIVFLDAANENEKYSSALENLSDYENTLIFAVNLINGKYYSFNPDKVPYSYCSKEEFAGIEQELSFIAENTVDLRNKSKVYDFLWIIFKNFGAASQALHGFIDSIFADEGSDRNYYIFNRCVNLCGIIRDLNFEYDFMKTLYRMIELGKKNENARSIKILELAYQNKWLTATQLSQPVKEKLKQYETLKLWNFFIILSKLYEKILFENNKKKYTAKPCKIEEITELRRKKVDYYINDSNNNNISIFSRVDSVKCAIEALKGIAKTEDERATLQIKLKELQIKLSQSMNFFEKSIDISEDIKLIKLSMEKLDDIEIVYYFIMSTSIYTYEEAEKQMFEVEKEFILKHICAEQILNKYGGLEAILRTGQKQLKLKI